MAFNETIKQLTTQTRNHADNFNEINNQLLENTKYNKEQHEALKTQVTELKQEVDAIDISWNNVENKPESFPPSEHNHNEVYYTESEVDEKLSQRAEKIHTHTKADITDFSHTHNKIEITDFEHTHKKSEITDFTHTHKKSEITDFVHRHNASEIDGLNTTVTWEEVTEKPESFPPSSHNHDDMYYTESETDTKLLEKAEKIHTHTKADITDFTHRHSVSEIDGLGDIGGASSWEEIENKPESFPPSTHRHNASEIDGLSDIGGVSSWDEITGKPDVFPPSQHNHNVATTSANGYMSKEDKKKLDGINKLIGKSGTGTFSEIFNDADGNVASGDYSHAEGQGTQATESWAHAEGYQTKAIDFCTHAEGYATEASGAYSHAEGQRTTASGSSSHSEGSNTTASGAYSHAEGERSIASGYGAHAEGLGTQSKAQGSHTQGAGTTASGWYSHAEGSDTTAETFLVHVQGRYNKVNAGVDNSYKATQNAFVIGNGASRTALSNAFRVTFDGKTYGLSAFNSTGADYAEYFEWEDGNPDNEDRIGHFVTLEGDKIRLANSEDDYIVGIISGNQSIIGNACEDSWSDMYLRDEFDRLQYEDVEVEKEEFILNKETKQTETRKVIVTEKHIKLNPNYNPDLKYIPRSNRKEWGIVGMLGQIVVKDDGTCKVNGYCKPFKNGIATNDESGRGYRVMKRISENLIKVIVK